MPLPSAPNYLGGSLPNLVAELEARLAGSTPGTRLADALSTLVPAADSYVLVLFDGLGAHQIHHPEAASLARAEVATLDAPFPTTTTVSLASVASALPPAQHGLLGYQLWMEEVAAVVNTIKWTTLWGEVVSYDTTKLLPSPNVWERLAAAGLEPVTVQPAHLADSALSRALYRGCRIEPVATVEELVKATTQLASVPGRLVFAYLPHVDFAGHVHGLHSTEYAAAIRAVAEAWEGLVRLLPRGALLVGTADHGLVDLPPARQAEIAKADHAERVFYGDGRAMFVRGDGASLAENLPATWVPIDESRAWWGPGPRHDRFAAREPDGILLADEGRLLLHRHSDDRLVGHHGGLTIAERTVPILVAGPPGRA